MRELKKAARKFGALELLSRTQVTWSTRMTVTGGYAQWYRDRECKIRFSVPMLARLAPDERRRVVWHEFLHLVSDERAGETTRPFHGQAWRALMVEAGLDPSPHYRAVSP